MTFRVLQTSFENQIIYLVMENKQHNTLSGLSKH